MYLGSFSKVLAPGLRLGYVVAPREVYPKLLQAKQAADLHTPGFNQRVVHEVIKDGFLLQHVPTIRARYKAQRDAMRAALERHMPTGTRWNVPVGGMFFWVELPAGVDAMTLLPRAVERGMAFVPGAPFFADHPQANTLRLSFVTVAPEQIERGVELPIAESLAFDFIKRRAVQPVNLLNQPLEAWQVGWVRNARAAEKNYATFLMCL